VRQRIAAPGDVLEDPFVLESLDLKEKPTAHERDLKQAIIDRRLHVSCSASCSSISSSASSCTRIYARRINRLRTKLEPDPKRPTYLVTVRGAGYRFARSGAADDLP
jgi:hypothetical protein